MAVTFDGINKIITLEDGVDSISVREDLYSAWVDWISISDNSKYMPAFRTVGGDEISSTKSLGLTFFIINGWKIRPYELDHTLTVDGNLYTDPAGDSPFTRTAGDFNITIMMAVSNLSDSTISQLDEIEYSSFNGAIHIDTDSVYTGTQFPVGTTAYPVNNLADAIEISVSRGILALKTISDITIPSGTYLNKYTLYGTGKTGSTITFETGSITSYCKAESVIVTGVCLGNISYKDCIILNLEGSGAIATDQSIIAEDCVFEGDLILPENFTGSMLAINCSASGDAIFNMSGSPCTSKINNWSGSLIIKNITSAEAHAEFNFASGSLTLDSTVTAGNFTISGNAKLLDFSTSITSIDNQSILPQIEYSSFNGAIHIDTDSVYSGTTFPVGTTAYPVNNLADAIEISENVGILALQCASDVTFPAGIYLEKYTFYGTGKAGSILTFEDGSMTPYGRCVDAIITGIGLGNVSYFRCRITDFEGSGAITTSQNIIAEQCIFEGTLNMPENFLGTMTAINCTSSGSTIFDFHGSPCGISVKGWSGALTFKNLTATPVKEIELDFASGSITLDSSVTAGDFTVRGNVQVINNATSVTSLHMETVTIAETAYRGFISIDTVDGIDGDAYPFGTETRPVKTEASALMLAYKYNLHTIHVRGEVTSNQAYDKALMTGIGELSTTVVNINDHIFESVLFETITIRGAFDPLSKTNQFKGCYLDQVENINGYAIDCSIKGTTTILPGGVFSAIGLIAEGDDVIIDLQNSAAVASIDITSGLITFKNAVAGSLIELNIKGGEVVLDASCTGGVFYAEGIGTLYNESAMSISEDHLIDLTTIESAIWDGQIANHLEDGSTGKALSTSSTGGVDLTSLAEAVWDSFAETNVSYKQAIQIFLSVLAGKSSGGGDPQITFRDINNTKDKIIATVDTNGNRTSVVIN